jgi:hypothetical protein
MNINPNPVRKVQVLPLAFLQILASVMLAFSTRTGVLHIGVFCIAISGAMLAVQMLAGKNYWHFAFFAISICAAFLIGGLFPFFMSAFSLPAAILIVVMVRKKSTKISVTAALDILYIALFALIFLSVYMLHVGEFSVGAVVGYFSGVIDTIKETAVSNIEPDVMEQIAKLNDVTVEEFLEMLDVSFEFFKLILPAILVAAVGVIAYLTAAFFKLGTAIAGCELVLPDPKWSTLPSRASALVFSLSYIVFSISTMFSSSFNVVMVVSLSIVIIFAPLMLLMGIKWFLASRNKTLIAVLFVAGMLFMTGLAIMILAFFGSAEVFKRHAKIEKQQTPPKN